MKASIALFGLLISAPALAQQTHPCDIQTPVTQTIRSGAPHIVGWCSPASDGVEAVVVYVNGKPFDLLPFSSVSGPSVTGDVFYETGLFLQVPRGDHAIELATYNRDAISKLLQLGPKSPPFAFAAADPTPVTSAPKIKGVRR